MASRFGTLALLPMASAIGCDVYVATERAFGGALALAAAALAFVFALAAWFGLGWGLKCYLRPQAEETMEKHPTPLHVKIEQMLTESRVILPGVQALLGFQFIVMMTKAFDELPAEVRFVHLGALLCMALAIALLIAPAAVHRLAFNGRDDSRMHTTGSVLVTLALIPLAVGLSADLFIALTRLFDGSAAAFVVAVAAFGVLIGLWYVVPMALRPAGRRAVSRRGAC